MAGMQGDHDRRKRPEEEYDRACELVIQRGHGGLKLTSEETGIPYDTLKEKVKDYRRRHAGKLEAVPPMPDNVVNAGQEKLKKVWWTGVCQLEASQEAGAQLNTKLMLDLDAMGRRLATGAPKDEKPTSALSSLKAA